MKNGFADVRIVSADGIYDPQLHGFVVTFAIDEGDQYHFGAVNINSRVAAVPGETLRSKLRTESGRIYNADAVEKSVEDVTIEMAKRGYPFSAVRPRGDRLTDSRLVNLTFLIEEGPHTYIERINVRGNTRTRDYVIRREFDIVEGDAYNRALVDRAERRVKNLGFFKNVKVTTEPGSAPDRVIINCEVEEQPTGEFSFSGGYSNSDGPIGEVSLGERNLMGTGQQGRVSVQYGEYAKGFNLSFVQPYFLDNRLALGTDLFYKEQQARYVSYTTITYGGDVKLGIPISDNFSVQTRYTGYVQSISLPSTLRNCNNVSPDFFNYYPTPGYDPSVYGAASPFYKTYVDAVNSGATGQSNCYEDGEASLAVRKELSAGPAFISAPGYTLAYSTVDNNRNPTAGLLAEFRQDIAGLGGDVRNIKTTGDIHLYNEILPDVVGVWRLQGGYGTGWGGVGLRELDQFQGGPNMVRGFAPAGFGPRDITEAMYGYSENDALGGSVYWATSVEFQTPLPLAPKDLGVKIALFSDAGALSNYSGPTSWPSPGPMRP